MGISDRDYMRSNEPDSPPSQGRRWWWLIIIALLGVVMAVKMANKQETEDVFDPEFEGVEDLEEPVSQETTI
jgi:hypothetical protein